MAFAQNDQGGVGDVAAGQRLNRCDLNLGQSVGPGMVRLHDADIADTLGIQCVDSLVNQADGRGGEDHAVALGQCACDDLRASQLFPNLSGLGGRRACFPVPKIDGLGDLPGSGGAEFFRLGLGPEQVKDACDLRRESSKHWLGFRAWSY